MDIAPKLGFEPLKQQEQYALGQLQDLLGYLQKQSPFYKELLEREGIDAGAITTMEALQQIPFTTKQDMQERNWDFLCVSRNKVREYTATSGTMGKPVTIALTARDLIRLAYNESQSFLCADGSADDVYQLMLTLDRQFMAGMAYYSGIQKMGASLVRTGPGLPQMQWEVIDRLQCNSLVAVPSFLVAMADWAKGHDIDLSAGPVQKAICIGESVRREDFSLNALGEKLAKEWPIKLYSTYAATELQTAFTECRAGKGGHHQPDLVIVEVVDDEGNAMPDGMAGEVVITTLGVEGMPLLRYRTGDVAALHAEPCSCGRQSKRMGPVIGRLGQLIKYKGTTLYPAAIFDVLAEVPFISGSVVEVVTGVLGTDEVRLHVHAKVNAEECETRLRPLLQSRLRVAPQLVFHTAEGLQAIQMPVGNRKPIRFIDSR